MNPPRKPDGVFAGRILILVLAVLFSSSPIFRTPVELRLVSSFSFDYWTPVHRAHVRPNTREREASCNLRRIMYSVSLPRRVTNCRCNDKLSMFMLRTPEVANSPRRFLRASVETAHLPATMKIHRSAPFFPFDSALV